MNAEPEKNHQEGLSKPSFRAAMKTLLGRIGRTIIHNWPWKIVALLLAIGLWAGLITQDPTLTRERIFTDVPISYSGVEALRRNGMIVISGLEDEALTARLRADVPQREYNNVTGTNYSPRVDLSRITETGEQELKILTTSITTYGTVTSVVPESIDVVVDKYTTNYRMPITLNQTGEYPAGFYGAVPTLNPSIVAVSGPESIVNQIAHIYVDFDVSKLSPIAATTRSALPIRFADMDGNTIESDLLEVTSADVLLRTITVEQPLYATKSITVSDQGLTIGAPAPGYELKSVTATPNILVAAGDEAKLGLLDTIFVDTPIDILGSTESFTTEIRLKKPSDIVYMNTDIITVHCEIGPVMITRVFDKLPLRARGQKQGVKVSLNVSSVYVAITGPQLMMDKLKASELTTYVNAGDMQTNADELPILLLIDDADISDISYIADPCTALVTTGD